MIALRIEGLLHWVAERVARFPREHRFTVGDRLLTACLDITENLVDAAYRRDNQASLAAASRGLVRARILMRLAHALRCVSEAQHLHFARESDEIGKMLGGWIRSAHPRDRSRSEKLKQRRSQETERMDREAGRTGRGESEREREEFVVPYLRELLPLSLPAFTHSSLVLSASPSPLSPPPCDPSPPRSSAASIMTTPAESKPVRRA